MAKIKMHVTVFGNQLNTCKVLHVDIIRFSTLFKQELVSRVMQIRILFQRVRHSIEPTHY